MAITVMLVDDNADTRQGLALMLLPEVDITVVGEAANGQQAVEMAGRIQPDVILMDVRMPAVDGIEATKRIIHSANTDARILILTTYDVDKYAFDALEAGASGFLLKDATPEQLIAAIRSVDDGDAVVTPRITRKLLDAVRRPQTALSETAVDEFAPLSPRERDVAIAVAEGLTNAEIAERLFLTVGSVKTYVNRILTKLNARDRIEIVIRGQKTLK